MNSIDSWHEEKFRCDLTDKVTHALRRQVDAATVAAAVAACARDAEDFCQDRPMACAAGCPHCCVLNVAVLLPEALIIAQWLRETLPPGELDQLQHRLAAHRSWARWMDDEERVLKRMRCPLLDDYGGCSVHAVRPLACRSIASLDSQSCRDAFAPVVTDDDRMVPVDLLRKAVYDAAFTALADGLRLSGLDDRSIELGAGVVAFLEDPQLKDELLSGKKLPPALWQ
jgi:Fe-S-cluster containining protein